MRNHRQSSEEKETFYLHILSTLHTPHKKLLQHTTYPLFDTSPSSTHQIIIIMRVLPAAILGLLSAASSVLPSSAVNTSASGVARKLSSKSEKSSGCSAENKELQAQLEFAIRLTSVARSVFAFADDDNSGTIELAEKGILQKFNPEDLDLEGEVTFEQLVVALNGLYAGGSCGSIKELQDALSESLELTLAVAALEKIEDAE